MKNRTSLFENRPLRRAFDFAAYFLLLLIVAAERPAIRIAACALLALALLAVVVLLVRAAKSRNDAAATDCPGDPLARTFVPIGFLALALVQTPADNRMLPLLYGFLGLYAVAGIVRLACRKRR